MEEFYVIAMNNKKLYLGCTEKEKAMKWTNLEEACWFNTYSEAEKFAQNYFKNFKNYFVYSFNYSI